MSLLVDEHGAVSLKNAETISTPQSGNVSPRFSDFLNKAKETAENVLKGSSSGREEVKQGKI